MSDDTKPSDTLKPPQAAADAIETTLLALVAECGQGKTISPSEIAWALAGKDEKQWGPMMKPIRAVAVRLAHEGQIAIRRKGKIVDPADFKGVYRIGPTDEA